MKNKIVAAFCISMLSVMLVMTGCSSKQAEKESDKKMESVKKTEDEVETKKTEKTSDDSTKEETQDAESKVQENDIVGSWEVDYEMTNVNNEDPVTTEFGSGINAGDNTLTFNEDGSFSWSLGIGNGGTGTYTEENGTITGTYAQDTDGSQKEITMVLTEDKIIMDVWGDNSYSVYWVKQ